MQCSKRVSSNKGAEACSISPLALFRPTDCPDCVSFHVSEPIQPTGPTRQETPAPRPVAVADAKRQFAKYLALGAIDPALELHRERTAAGHGWRIDPAQLQPIIDYLKAEKRWQEVAPLMVEQIDQEQQRVNNLRITLAQICVKKIDRPAQAIELLAPIDHRYLSAGQRDVAIEMQGRARRMQAEDQNTSPTILPINENSPGPGARG